MLLANLLGITAAYAANAAPAGGQSMMSMVVIVVAFAGVMYFLMIRPQSKRAKAHQELVSGLKKGDEVVVGGGMFGKISKVADAFLVIEIATGVEIKIQKGSVAMTVPKGTIKSL